MPSKVDICNMALSRIGAATITSLTQGTRESKLCNTFFNTLAERAMIQGSWTSTITRAELAQTTNTPVFGYAYEYQLPVDPKCLKILGVNEWCPGEVKYVREGDKILTDSDTLSIRYIALLTNTEDYGTGLTEAVEILLASYLAKPLATDPQVSERLRQEYFEIVANNLAIDNQQGSQQVIHLNDSISVR